MRRVVASVVVAVLALVGCSANAGESGFVGGDGSLSLYPPTARREMPPLAGNTLTGEHLDVGSLRGKPVVLNVWGSWCGPCRKEAPALVKAQQRIGDGGHMVGINSRDADASAAVAFTRSFGISYPNLYDPKGELVMTLGRVSSTAIPTTVVLDKSGKVAAVKLGEITESTLVGIVEDLNKEA